MPQQDENQKLLAIHRRRLQILKEQRATKGINTEPHIIIEIENLEAEIAKLQGVEDSSAPEEPKRLPPKLAEDANPKVRVQIYLRGNFSSLTDELRSSTVEALAGLLRIPPTTIELFRVYEGSIVFDLGIPIEAVPRLRSLLQSNHTQLHQLKIEKVIFAESAELEEWGMVNGKFGLITSVHPPASNSSNRESQSAEMPTPSRSDLSYALVMKGGGIKGLAYVGALEELEKHYTFNWFVGTSAGAIAAVLLAAGYTVSELKDILYQKDFRDFLDAKWYEWPWNFLSQRGIHPAYEFTNWIEKLLAEKLDSPVQVKLKDLKYRVTIYASRRDEDALIFDSHDPKTQDTPAAHAVRCSMSIPFIFTPQMRDGMRVLDGGMRHNYPVGVLLRGQPNQNFVGLYLGPETYEGQAKPPHLIGDLLSIWTEAADVKALREYGNKTVIIDPRPIGTVDFALDEEEKNFLLEAGKAAVHKFLLKQGILTNKNKITTEYEKIKQVRNQITQKRKTQRRKRTIVGIVVALVIALILTGLTVGIPKINGGNDATSSPTPIQTEDATAKVALTSTPTPTSSPTSVVGDTPVTFHTPTHTPTTLPSEGPIIIEVRVVAGNTGEVVPDAVVQIVGEAIHALDKTDKQGVVKIEIDFSHKGESGELRIEGNGFQSYVRPIEILDNVITIELVPAAITPVPTDTTPTGNLAIPVVFNFGTKVYLTGFDGAGINGPNEVSIGGVPGSEDARQPMFSRDGKSLIVKATIDGVSGLYKLTASGFNPEITMRRGSPEWPVLSPDGETVMFSEGTLDFRLHKRLPSPDIDTPEKNIEEISLNGSPIFAKNLLWSEDNRLVFQGCAVWRNAPTECGTWITYANNLDPQRIIVGMDAQPMSIRGGTLAYMQRETDKDWNIFIMSLDDGKVTQVTSNGFEDGLPAISPDGTAVAYISNESGTWGVWTVNLDGQNKKHWFDIDPGRGTIDTNEWSTERMSWRR